MVMVFNATFNNISVISWKSVLLVEETRVPGENHRPVASHWHNIISSTPRHERIPSNNFSGNIIDYTGSCKSNYHAMTTTTAPIFNGRKDNKTTTNNIHHVLMHIDFIYIG
jgi:hypothetical protein